MRTEDITTTGLSAIGLTISLADFKTWLDIVLIILSILNITIILIIKLKKYLKDGKLSTEEKKDIIEDIKQLQDHIDKLNKEEKKNG